MGVGQGQVQQVGGEIAVTGGTTMFRVGHLQRSRPTGQRIAQVVQHPMTGSQSVGPASAAWAGPPAVITRPLEYPRRGKVFDASDAFGGVGNVLSGAIHDLCLREIRFLRGKYRQIQPLESRK